MRMPAKSIEINLIGDTGFDKTPTGRLIQWATTYGRYIMIGTEVVVLLAFISRFTLDRKITDLKEEIQQKQAILQANLDFENEYKNIQERINIVTGLIENQTQSVDILAYIQTIVPTDVFIQSFQLSGSTINAEVAAGTTAGFSQFLVNLMDTTFFTDVRIHSVSRQPNLGIQFSFSTTLSKKG